MPCGRCSCHEEKTPLLQVQNAPANAKSSILRCIEIISKTAKVL